MYYLCCIQFFATNVICDQDRIISDPSMAQGGKSWVLSSLSFSLIIFFSIAEEVRSDEHSAISRPFGYKGFGKRLSATDFHLGFGKRLQDSDQRTESQLTHYTNLHAGFGNGDKGLGSQVPPKRGNYNSLGRGVNAIRRHGSDFHMGFGKRQDPEVGDEDNRATMMLPLKKAKANRFHMGFGKRSPIQDSSETEKRSPHGRYIDASGDGDVVTTLE